jgi:hypothetical protein
MQERPPPVDGALTDEAVTGPAGDVDVPGARLVDVAPRPPRAGREPDQQGMAGRGLGAGQ